MRKRTKKILALIMTAVVTAAIVPQMEKRAEKVQAAATQLEASDFSALQSAVAQSAKSEEPVEIKLTANITDVKETLELMYGNLTLDLNGYTITESVPLFDSYYSADSSAYMDQSTLTITDSSASGTGKIENTEDKGEALRKSGGKLNITGGTYSAGDIAVYIAGGVEQAVLEGGTYKGRIARQLVAEGSVDYSAFYGKTGVIAEGCVLTDNTFTIEDSTIYTPADVAIVKGWLVELYTGRSSLESYTENEWVQAEYAEHYSMSPVSVGAGGKVYINSDKNTVPVIDSDRVTDGSAYTFRGWCDETGVEYASVEEFVKAQGMLASDRTLKGKWDAKVSSAEGLQNAVDREQAVTDIQVVSDIELKDRTIVNKVPDTSVERTLDLDGNTISSVPTAGPALDMSGTWNIKNGKIESNGGGCIGINGTAVLDGLDCMECSYGMFAVRFYNVTGDSASRILSGRYRTAEAQGHAVMATGDGQETKAEYITNLFQNSYASCLKTVTTDNVVCLASSGLLVAQTPITYIEDDGKAELGTFEYGQDVPEMECSISNESYMGDITVTGVSVDNPAFRVTGQEAVTLTGGSTDKYGYTITAAGRTPAGNYEGTVYIHYIRMDGEPAVCKRTVTMNVTAKKLTISEPEITKMRAYDGTTMVNVIPGKLQGVVSDDDVSVTAAAVYDSADVGTGKTITVIYGLSGKDKDNYQAPSDVSYKDGVINRAEGKGTVFMADYHVGEEPPVPEALTDTNDMEKVSFYYKPADSGEDAYTSNVPEDEGSYTVKAVFEETETYHEVVVTADFTVSYIETPSAPYTLSGTRGEAGWFRTSVTVSPAKGYTISTQQRGNYAAVYTVDDTAAPVVYLRNENGAVTRAIQMETIQIDKAAPVIEGIKNGALYYSDEPVTAVVSDEHLMSVTVNGKTVDGQGSSRNITLDPADTAYTLTAQDMAGNTTTYRVTVKKHFYDVTVQDADMGTCSYGSVPAPQTVVISNEKSTGAIVITDVSTQSDSFRVQWEKEPVVVEAGRTAQVYTIETCENIAPGTCQGSIQITYTRLDGTAAVCSQKITVTVTPCELSVTSPDVTRDKVYDGTDYAQVTAGSLKGVVSGDDVSVSARAFYNDVNAGENKLITVSYMLSGADSDKYLPPEDEVYKNGSIRKAEGSAAVAIGSWRVGEPARSPELGNVTEGLGGGSYFYKRKGVSDNEYRTNVPADEGDYIIKAVFAESTNYKETQATNEFSISYIDTPQNAFSLSGVMGKNGWYVSDVNIFPADGYTIASERDGSYWGSCTVDDSVRAADIYLKSATGAVTRAIRVGDILIDKQSPAVSGLSGDEIYYADELTVTITDANLSRVLVNGAEQQIIGERAELVLTPADAVYIIEAEDKAGNITQTSAFVEEAWMREGIISSGIKRLKTSKKYKLGTGQWKVRDDSTVYHGGTDIYVPAGGSYDFQKQ